MPKTCTAPKVMKTITVKRCGYTGPTPCPDGTFNYGGTKYHPKCFSKEAIKNMKSARAKKARATRKVNKTDGKGSSLQRCKVFREKKHVKIGSRLETLECRYSNKGHKPLRWVKTNGQNYVLPRGKHIVFA